MIFNADKLFVVISYGDRWSNSSLVTDDVYTDEAEARGIAEDKNRRWKAMNHKVDGYGVSTLSAWFKTCEENGGNDEARRNDSSGY